VALRLPGIPAEAIRLGRGGGVCGGALAQPRGELVGRHGSREEVALSDVAAEVCELLPALLGLDALGDDLQAEVAAEVYRRADDHRIVPALLHVEHEGAV